MRKKDMLYITIEVFEKQEVEGTTFISSYTP
jgi:hypothetical protein